MSAITADGLCRRFSRGRDEVIAVDDVSFSIEPGETVALMGANGAGKSTLLDLLCGLTDPTAGRVSLLDATPRAAVQRGRVAAMLQSGGLLPDLTVAETVTLVASLFGRPGERQRVLTTTGLDAIADRRLATCSGGERQRVKFALALIPDADVLILDEPTAGMDWRARADFWARMRELADAGRTLVYATHYADEVEGIADRVLVLAGGRLVADTTVAAITGAAPRSEGSDQRPPFFARLDDLIREGRAPE